ncbi:MAG: DUF1801 domain-containing protein [Saprospiraceae bacterium]|jgi:hypothetical protein|nr:DUF1801 domain-containing protein [Saprospiraceae bacterium]
MKTNIQKQIEKYLESLPETKRNDMLNIQQIILNIMPDCKIWFLDGKNDAGKTISNPNIGYGSYLIKYADGKTREFYQIGLSGNKTGISVYILGIADKNYLKDNYAQKLGKASVTGYCIKFKTLLEINIDVLEDAIRNGVEISSEKS